MSRQCSVFMFRQFLVVLAGAFVPGVGRSAWGASGRVGSGLRLVPGLRFRPGGGGCQLRSGPSRLASAAIASCSRAVMRAWWAAVRRGGGRGEPARGAGLGGGGGGPGAEGGGRAE